MSTELAIFKFSVPARPGMFSVPMPVGAKILTAQMQRGNIAIWATCRVTADQILRSIRVFGTGQPDTSAEFYTYIATVQDGEYVWHVFDDGEVE